MLAFWKEPVPDKIIKRRPADVQILTSLVFAHPVVSDPREHLDNLFAFFLGDVAVTRIYVTDHFLQ